MDIESYTPGGRYTPGELNRIQRENRIRVLLNLQGNGGHSICGNFIKAGDWAPQEDPEQREDHEFGGVDYNSSVVIFKRDLRKLQALVETETDEIKMRETMFHKARRRVVFEHDGLRKQNNWKSLDDIPEDEASWDNQMLRVARDSDIDPVEVEFHRSHGRGIKPVLAMKVLGGELAPLQQEMNDAELSAEKRNANVLAQALAEHGLIKPVESQVEDRPKKRSKV